MFGSYWFRVTTLLVQAQFAWQPMGVPGHGEHNLLATNARLVTDVRLLMDVSRMDFVPIPIVVSTLVENHPKRIQPKEFAPGVDLRVARVPGSVEGGDRERREMGDLTFT
ncbi:ribosomal RNA small subunit methyltransferase, mitochondrial-like [Oryza sativa Japonica Group]